MSMNPFFEDIVIEMSGTGPTGKTGNSIASIEKTGTSGLTDIYTITMTWGQTYTFDVENGNGIQSITKTGTDVLTDTYTILYTNGTSTTFEVVNGNGIANIAKTSTDILSDTYTITYTNGTTTTYTVTNGKGIMGIEKTSTAGLVDTYTITYNDGTTSTYTVTNGEKGDTGNGIESITKTSTAGLVDTYTILYTNGQTATFTVTNGNGISGISKTGTSGLTDTYTISFTDGTSTTYTVVNGNGISSITKTSTVDLVDTYTITYTNGTTSTFDVTNGEKGDTGNGIASIEKTSTVGLVDTYTITFTDGTTTTFDVTNGSDTWGNITGTLSDQTDLQSALDNKADIILSSASGAVASFSDGGAYPVTALSVGIEPVQDLHGQSSPYPAGGGKNLANISDATVTSQTNLGTVTLPAGTYAASCTATNNGSIVGYFRIIQGSTQLMSVGVNTDANKTRISGSFTLTEQAEVIVRGAGASAGYNFSVADIQIESGSTATSYAPYSNICPISGHTSAVVTRTGKNWLDASAVTWKKWYLNNNAFYTAPDSDSTVSWAIGSDGETVTVTTTTAYRGIGVSISSADSDRIFSLTTASSKVALREEYADNSSTIGSGTTISVPVPANTSGFVAIRFDTAGTYTFKAQLELGSTATAYEPYQAQQVIIDLDGTRYGGTLNVLTGEMTITRTIKVYDGTESWTQLGSDSSRRFRRTLSAKTGDGITSHFEVVNTTTGVFGKINLGQYITILDNNSYFADADAVKAWVKAQYDNGTPLEVVYELDTPITVQLTPSQMQTLLGDNAIWADTGDVSVEYRADTKLYIQNLTKPTEDDMTANANITSGKYFMIGNRLFLSSSSIASGDAIIPGTNCQALSLADALNQINA